MSQVPSLELRGALQYLSLRVKLLTDEVTRIGHFLQKTRLTFEIQSSWKALDMLLVHSVPIQSGMRGKSVIFAQHFSPKCKQGEG